MTVPFISNEAYLRVHIYGPYPLARTWALACRLTGKYDRWAEGDLRAVEILLPSGALEWVSSTEICDEDRVTLRVQDIEALLLPATP